ncbi:hypothetical protein [Tropicibacter sp. Alg240-R139]|uniref:AMP-binding enzyme n=1 Tax=Tropicibacter sp. Alg240-R139 TaxID=2305991 RepID=UPI0035931B97
MDEDGFLYLTDRKSFMIISGGVNIYPQEIEDRLSRHPEVFDVAVIGTPHTDFGEHVTAVVQLRDHAKAGDTLTNELIKFARETLSGVKVPKVFNYSKALPRTETGKLLKKKLRDSYWS